MNGRKFAIELDGQDVRIVIRCANHYEAIALYDEANAALNDTGTLEFRVDGATPANEVTR